MGRCIRTGKVWIGLMGNYFPCKSFFFFGNYHFLIFKLENSSIYSLCFFPLSPMLSPWLNKFPLHHFPSPSLINLSSPISAMTRLSKKFPSQKNPRLIQSKSSTSSPIILSPTDSNSNHSKKANATEIAASSSSPKSMAKAKAKIGSKWSVYLIISSTLPRTYVGVTTNFPRR